MMFIFGRSQMKNEEEILNTDFVLLLHSPPAPQGILPSPVRSPTALLPLPFPPGSPEPVDPALSATLQLPRAPD